MANMQSDKSQIEQLKQDAKPEDRSSGFSRRRFLQGIGVVGAGAVMGDASVVTAQASPAMAPEKAASGPSAAAMDITLTINGKARNVSVEPRTTLLSAMRDRLEPALTGPKLVCNMGTCGACTVIMDGKTVYGCSVLAVDAIGKKITTVEGIGTPEHLSPVQEAFCKHDGMMCGFCTSGMVTSVTALLESNASPTLEDVKEGLHGNFCRCGTYTRIFAAALDAAKVKAGK